METLALPSDVWRIVLSFLPGWDLASSARLVSRRWRQVAEELLEQRVRQRTKMEQEIYCVSAPKLEWMLLLCPILTCGSALGVPAAVGAYYLFAWQARQSSFGREDRRSQGLWWAADGGQLQLFEMLLRRPALFPGSIVLKEAMKRAAGYELGVELAGRGTARERCSFQRWVNRSDSRQVVSLLLDLRVCDNYAECFAAAARGGFKEMMDLFWEKIPADKRTEALEDAVLEAAFGGHLPVVRRLADQLVAAGGSPDWQGACCEAASGGHRAVLDLCLARCAENDDVVDYGSMLARAAQYNRRAMVDHLISLGADAWDDALESAAFGGHEELVAAMLERGAHVHPAALESAAGEGNTGVLAQLWAAPDERWLVPKSEVAHDALVKAAESGYLDAVRWLCEHRPFTRDELDGANASAAQHQQEPVAEYLQGLLAAVK